MRVGVCDFPSAYAFPPYGYGGIERWLWAVAVGARQAGAEVHLIGPSWRTDVPGVFGRLPVRLEDIRPGDESFRMLDRLDLDVLVVGHEYPSLAAWRGTWSELPDVRVVTFQHDPNFNHEPVAFDGDRSVLFCYSPEMVNRYADHTAVQAVSVQFGAGEEDPQFAVQGKHLIWLGRIDRQKAPHIAIDAARLLGKTIHLIGPVLDEEYAKDQADALNASHVRLVGEVAGAAKLDLLRQGAAMLYTCAADHVEAGAAVFGEALRTGTPVAALAWRPGTCAEVALCEHTGDVVRVAARSTDIEAAEQLAAAVRVTTRLDATDVQHVGLDRFSPERHFRDLIERRPG